MNAATEQSSMVSSENYFVEKLQQGEFLLQHCMNCKQFLYYPRLMCTKCGSQDLQWQKPSGLGTVYSFTIVRRRPERGGDYNLALIDLDEGPRMQSRIEGVDPEEINIGMQVTARIVTEHEAPLVLFVPVVRT